MREELDRILTSGHHSQSERYLITSLASARESISALDRANKVYQVYLLIIQKRHILSLALR